MDGRRPAQATASMPTMETCSGNFLWLSAGEGAAEELTGHLVVVQESQELCLHPLLHLQWENSAWL